MSDGKVVIDTELDSKGLQSGLSSLGGKVKKGMATEISEICMRDR